MFFCSAVEAMTNVFRRMENISLAALRLRSTCTRCRSSTRVSLYPLVIEKYKAWRVASVKRNGWAGR